MCGLVLATLYYWSRSVNKKTYPHITGSVSQSNPIELTDNDLLEVSADLTPYLKENASLDRMNIHARDLNWVGKDSYRIAFRGTSEGIEIQDYTCNKQEIPLADRESVYRKLAKDMGDIITKSLIALGYKQNQRNTSTTFNENSQTQFYDYTIGFEKEKKVCIYKANPDCSAEADESFHTTFTLTCSSEFDKYHAEQLPFQRDLKKVGQVLIPDKIEGDFALLTAGGIRGGYLLIAKRISDVWTEVWSGNGVVECDPIMKAKVPRSLVTDCYDKDADQVVSNTIQ